MTPPNLSLILIMVCFWLTMWLVQRFLIRPVGHAISERSRRIKDAQHEWTTKHDDYEAAISRVESEIEDAAREAAKIRAEARNSALEKRQVLLDAARDRADRRLQEALQSLASEAEAARTELRRQAAELARLLAGRLLEREVGP